MPPTLYLSLSPLPLTPTLFFPPPLIASLNQDEFEAIVAHEAGHLQWADGWTRTSRLMISSLFWWIPAHWLHQKIEKSQEEACDRAVNHFGISPIALAHAALLSARYAKSMPAHPLLSSFSHHCDLAKRVEKILDHSQSHRFKPIHAAQLVCLIAALLSIVGGRLWIF